MCNGIVRTGFGALTTFFTFGCVNVGTVMSRFNCPKLTGIDTCLSKTVLTVLCYCVAGDRTVFAGRRNNLDDIAIIFRSRSFAFCEADSLADDLTLFVDTAAELRGRSRNKLQREVITLFFKFTCKSKLSNSTSCLILITFPSAFIINPLFSKLLKNSLFLYYN